MILQDLGININIDPFLFNIGNTRAELVNLNYGNFKDLEKPNTLKVVGKRYKEADNFPYRKSLRYVI